MDDVDRAPDLFITALSASVPLQVETLRGQPDWAIDDLAVALRSQIQIPGADAMLFGGRKGEAAQAFAAWTRAFAVLALRAEGGIDFRGQHWCSTWGCLARSRYEHAGDRPEPCPEPAPAIRALNDVIRDLADCQA